MFRTRPLAQLLRHAIAKRQANELQRLLAAHGLVPFTAALAVWSSRVVADGLSQLPADARAPVLRHLPRALRDEFRCPQGMQAGKPVAIKRQGGLVRLPASSTPSPSINVAAADIGPAEHIAEAPGAVGLLPDTLVKITAPVSGRIVELGDGWRFPLRV